MAEEKTFENKIKDYLKEKGAWFIKYWGGGQFTKAGIPDLLVCYNGKFIAIELKASNGKPSLLQIITLEKIRNAAGYGFLLYPSDFNDFKQFIESSNERWVINNIELQVKWKKLLLNS